MANYIDTLPSELKERLFIYVDKYKTVANVSRGWRNIVGISKKLMQRELDKYFFFFIVGLQPFSSFVVYPTTCVFPIANEEQLIFLQQHEGKNAQVGALRERDDLPLSLFRRASINRHYVVFFPTQRKSPTRGIGSTEGLIRHLESGGKLVSYLAEKEGDLVRRFDENDSASNQLPWRMWDLYPFLRSKTKFTTVETMRKILSGEHIVLRDHKGALYAVKPRNYAKLEQFFKTGEDLRKRKVYISITQSLFEPRWWNFEQELKTPQDFELLINPRKW